MMQKAFYFAVEEDFNFEKEIGQHGHAVKGQD